MNAENAPLKRVWIDPQTGLPLPEPYPEYVRCPHCGEPEVEVWCFMPGVRCHRCGGWVPHEPPDCLGSSPVCQKCLSQLSSTD